MKKYFVTLALFGTACVTFAQNSNIWKAEENYEEGKYAEALAKVDLAVTNPKTTELARGYNIGANSQAHLLAPELLKASQGQPFDTAMFVSGVDKAISYYTKSHENDVKPDKKGRVKPKFQANNFKMIRDMLPYYNYSAQFLYMNKNLDGAAEMFTKYIAMPDNPIFSKEQTDSIRKANARDYAQAANNVAMIRFDQKRWKDVLAVVDQVLADSAYMHDAYVMKMQALLQTKDTANWVLCAQNAVADLEDGASIAQSLLYYYVEKNQVKEAQDMAAKMVADNPDNKNAWYMKGCVDLNLVKDFETARADFQKTLAIDPNHYEANMNTGVTYVNEVIARRDKGEFCTDRTKVKEFNESIEKMRVFYKNALPFFEKARMLAPEKVREWGPALQNAYTNLEMKDKAEEVKALLGQSSSAK